MSALKFLIILATVGSIQATLSIGKKTNKPDCSNGKYGLFSDGNDCQKYYQCFNRSLSHMTCPPGGAWTNKPTPACLQLYNVKDLCGSRPFRPEKVTQRFINITFVINYSPNDTLPIKYFFGVVLQQPLYHIMLNFAATREDFRFKSTFHPLFWRSVTCINNLCGAWNPDKTYWKIVHNNKPIPVGVSSFTPQPNSVVRFHFTVGGKH